MIKILNLFEHIGFIPDKDGTYIGGSFLKENGKTRFEFKNGMLTCTIKDDTEPKVIFSVLYGDINIGIFLSLLQEYGIISFSFIKNYLQKIEKDMDEYIKENEEHI